MYALVDYDPDTIDQDIDIDIDTDIDIDIDIDINFIVLFCSVCRRGVHSGSSSGSKRSEFPDHTEKEGESHICYIIECSDSPFYIKLNFSSTSYILHNWLFSTISSILVTR